MHTNKDQKEFADWVLQVGNKFVFDMYLIHINFSMGLRIFCMGVGLRTFCAGLS